MKSGAIIFIIAIVAGVAFGIFTRGNSRSERSDKSTKLKTVRLSERKSQRMNHPAWASEDFLRYAKETEEAQKHPLGAELANWTDAEIEAALNESLSNPEWLLTNSPTSKVAFELLGEWMKRDFDGAYAWTIGIQEGKAKYQLISFLAEQWPPDRAVEGFTLLQIYPELIQPKYRKSFINAELEAKAAQGGAKAVAATLDLMRAESLLGRSYGFEGLRLPADFDFTELSATQSFKKSWGSAEFTDLFDQWVSAHSEDAFAWVYEEYGPAGFADISQKSKSDSLFNLLGEEFESWEDADRESFLSASIQKQGLRMDALIASMVTTVTDPMVADEIRTMGIQGIFHGQAAKMLPLLDGMDPGRRVDALLMATQVQGGDNRLVFTSSDEKLLREKLDQWQVSAEQTEEIVQRFKP